MNYNENRQEVPVFKHEYPSPHIYREGPFDGNLVLHFKASAAGVKGSLVLVFS